MEKPKAHQRLHNELTHARQDPLHVSTRGLFSSFRRGDRRHLKLNVVHVTSRGDSIEFSGPEPLGSDDLRVLLGLIAMAGHDGLRATARPTTPAGHAARAELDLRGDGQLADVLLVNGSYRSLAQAIGYNNVGDTSTIRDCIERLFKVTLICAVGGRRIGSRLLSEYAGDEKSGGLSIALNPGLSAAILGSARHIRIELDEVRRIKGAVALIVFHRMCGWINPGSTSEVREVTLSEYAWPSNPVSPSAERMRRKRLLEALDELKTVGWVIDPSSKGKFRISRPIPQPLSVTVPTVISDVCDC